VDKETGYDMTVTTSACPGPATARPEMKHPGSPNLYDTSKHVMDGGGNFRANFGVEREGVSLLAGRRLALGGRRHHHRLPRVRPRAAEEAGLVGRPHRRREEGCRRQELEDRPHGGIIRVFMMAHGCHPFGNAKARAVVWNFPDGIPQHREPIYGTRPGPGRQVPQPRRPEDPLAPAHSVQDAAAEERRRQGAREIPAHHDLRPLVEYEGGGEETRSNPWLAELQQEMFVEINPRWPRPSAASATASASGSAPRPARASTCRPW
jgi:formate dehydrogenase major subunit